MLERLKALLLWVRDAIVSSRIGPRAARAAWSGASRTVNCITAARGLLVAAVLLGGAGYLLYRYPPVKSVGRGEVGIRINLFTHEITEWRDGSVLAVPGLHEMRVYSLRDRSYRPEGSARADGTAPLQSLEGLSIGVDLSVRYALDPAKLRAVASNLPDNIAADVVEPAVQGVIYKIFARYTVREIFSTKRVEIQQAIESDLAARLAADGIALRGVLIGKVDLPADYRRGMEVLLAEELANEKMRYTLEFKDKRVKEIALDGEAEKVRREKSAEAAAREQVIAAKAQEEAMKHVLPFKERQIEQRKLEAEAEKASRIKQAEGSAQARRIEANGEADARQRLAEAEAYRLEKIGKANADQLGREGAIITSHPLLIQKTLAEKLSDKLQIIIAPPAEAGILSATLLGAQPVKRP
jgi:regulator of protease activity HflC (stomatin/prohibitin superfamily)